jgi:hypothetical protein
VRQPYAELIMRKEKNIGYGSKPTKMRERVCVNVAKRPGGEVEDFERAGLRPRESYSRGYGSGDSGFTRPSTAAGSITFGAGSSLAGRALVARELLQQPIGSTRW